MKIHKDDNVIVITGKDKGKTGKVARAYPKDNTVIVPGVNVKKVHKRATRSGQKGQTVEKTFPIHVSNVMIVDPESGKRTRIGTKEANGKKSRVTKKTGSILK